MAENNPIPYQLAYLIVRGQAGRALRLAGARYLPNWRIEETRATDLQVAQMPWIGYFTAGESDDLLATGGTAPNYTATTKLDIIVRAAHKEKHQAECARDEALAVVKWALLSGQPFGFLAAPIEKVTAIEILTAVDAAGETNIANAIMSMQVVTREEFYGPDGAPLITFAATIKPLSPVGITVAETITLPQGTSE